MIVTQLPDTLDSLVFEASPPRSAGLHLSTIIKSICHDCDPRRFPIHTTPIDPERAELGFVFERVLETAFMSRRLGIFRPEEVVVDGIAMSPDGIDPDGWWLEEFKSTEMSLKGAPTDSKFVHWIWQIKCYCRAIGTTKARLRVLFLRGDYREIRRAYRVWELHFTQDELDACWTMILTHARREGMLEA